MFPVSYADNGATDRKVRRRDDATYPWNIFITLTVALFKNHQMHSDRVRSNICLSSPIRK